MNTDTIEYYKNEAILYGTLFGITLLVSLIMTFFSYQKSIGNYGFMESLSPFVRSFYNSGPEFISSPVIKSVLFSSLSIAGFVLIMLIVSRLVIYIADVYSPRNKE